ncbi:hypothetical protein [Streptomyces solicathayae]|uniref:Uncharacterized protein n=1 Tax=Streptomyces solicathayae TaxID=3081768 RepID=A0ABZ0LRI5_9ACTN|nr:hypothetical protein [Streptomyces sp. HUAS YS2]WOX22084.1 hypothetical protein R2D22_12055 [Streptomyces sp. HUAS YS2]
MSTPPQPPPYGPGPQQPPNPYAGGPQQPGPYGAPAQGAPQGVPPQYPGPGPAQGGWGQPPAPYGPPQPPFGQPQPPRKSRTGLVLGIVGGVLLVGVLVVVGLAFLGRSLFAAAESSFPEAEYKLTVPKTLLAGEYKLLTDSSKTEGKEVEDTIDPTVRDAKAAIAQYEGKNAAVLVVSGFHGRLSDPEGTRALILKGAADDPNTKIAVPAKNFTPAGHDITISCQVARSTEGGVTSTLPMCAWGDDNTASFVAVVTAETALMAPEKVDLAAIAETTAKVRAEMRKPIG